MNATPKVSVIIPTYNRERFLPISVRSVQRQSFKDWELIIVDDRSPDGTRDLVRQISSEDSRIRYVANTRGQGPGGARNQGILASRGQYIALIDDDDEWEVFHLEDAIRILTENAGRVDLFTANALRKRWTDKEVVEYDELDLSAYPAEQKDDVWFFDSSRLFDLALKSRVMTTQTIVARREVFEKVPFDEGMFGVEDCLFPPSVVHYGFSIAHRQKYHVIYWVHDGNMSNRDGVHPPEKVQRMREAFVQFYLRLLEKLPLSAEQHQWVIDKLAEHYVWILGYNTYLAMGQYDKARQSYLKGIRLKPFRLGYWKVLLTSYLKQLVRQKPRNDS